MNTAGDLSGAALKGRVRLAREPAFLSACALLFVAGAWGTIAWCGSMSGGMPMRGGWTMSMAWMRMPGQTWPGAAASFMGMWVVMMLPMMLPSLAPMLSNYRRSVRGPEEIRLGGLVAVAAAITVERLAPNAERAARAVGVVVIAAGAFAIARALGAV
jgi:predicted metal-binding membrane protein